MTRERVETLIIGGGQAGLAMSHMLSQRGCRHLVLERGRIAERWRTERWMSGIDRSLSSKSEQDNGMRSTNEATQSRRRFLNIDMLLRISTALLITFAAALVLVHAEFYCFGMFQGVGSRSNMPGPAYSAPEFPRAWE